MTAPLKRDGVPVQLLKVIEQSRQDDIGRCRRKTRYADEFAARAGGIHRMEADQAQLWIYRCKHCRGWHLTKSEHAPYFAANYFEVMA